MEFSNIQFSGNTPDQSQAVIIVDEEDNCSSPQRTDISAARNNTTTESPKLGAALSGPHERAFSCHERASIPFSDETRALEFSTMHNLTATPISQFFPFPHRSAGGFQHCLLFIEPQWTNSTKAVFYIQSFFEESHTRRCPRGRQHDRLVHPRRIVSSKSQQA